MNRLILTACAILLLALTAGCPGPIGACRYSTDTERRGQVVVQTVEKVILDDGKEMMKVSVDGFFRRDFYITPGNYRTCFAEKGYGKGTLLTGIIAPGGPCPPMYRLLDCNLH